MPEPKGNDVRTLAVRLSPDYHAQLAMVAQVDAISLTRSHCCGFPKFPAVDHWNSPGDERCGGPGMSLRGCQVRAS